MKTLTVFALAAGVVAGAIYLWRNLPQVKILIQELTEDPDDMDPVPE